jgi:hypothetical protein
MKSTLAALMLVALAGSAQAQNQVAAGRYQAILAD